MVKRFDVVTDVNPARIRRARSQQSASSGKSTKDVDYTIPGIIVLFAIVLLTALYLNDGTAPTQPVSASSPNANAAGGAISTGTASSAAGAQCQAQNYCDGSRLVRQNSDCTRFVANCQNGCVVRADGFGVCR